MHSDICPPDTACLIQGIYFVYLQTNTGYFVYLQINTGYFVYLQITAKFQVTSLLQQQFLTGRKI